MSLSCYSTRHRLIFALDTQILYLSRINHLPRSGKMANVDLRAIKHNHPLFTLGQFEKHKALQIKTTNFQIANQSCIY